MSWRTVLAALVGGAILAVGTSHLQAQGAIPPARPNAGKILSAEQGEDIGGGMLLLAPGATVYIPPGTWWGLENAGNQPATVMFMFGQAEVERCFRKGLLHLSPQDSAGVERACPFEFR